MLTLTIECNRMNNETVINDVLGLGGFSGMQSYNGLTGEATLTLQTEEVQTEIGFLSIVIQELHKLDIGFTLTNNEV